MLIIGHVGYTLGSVWALESATHRENPIDFRAIALMSMAPDIIDRILFVFVLPSATSGRLIAHTILFQLVFLLVSTLARRDWWLYGASSVFHLVLDSTGLPMVWIRHLLWPLLAVELSSINIYPGAGDITIPYPNWIWLRIQQALGPYEAIVWWVWLLELGGALVLAAFAYRKSLYQTTRLRRFILRGNL